MAGLFSYTERTAKLFNPAPPRLIESPVAAPHIAGSEVPTMPMRSMAPGLPPMAATPHRPALWGQTVGYQAPVQPPGAESNTQPTQWAEVIGQPSLNIYQDPQNQDTVVELRRLTNYGAYLTPNNLAGLRYLLHDVRELYVQMSQGPLSLKDLRKAGHPYGFDAFPSKPRPVPRSLNGKRIGHVKGVRGSVPTLAIINKQSGHLAESWTSEIRLDEQGARLIWRNTAKSKRGFAYPFALAMSTPKMQAHGPWTQAPLRYMTAIDAEWRSQSRKAWMRSQQAEQLEEMLRKARL